MTFNVVCPKCGMTLSATDADIGKQGQCSRCQTVFAIQPPTAPPLAPHPASPGFGAGPQFPGGGPQFPGGMPPVWGQSALTGSVQVGEGISRGFALLHSDLGAFLLISLVFFGVSLGLGIASALPFIGILISLASTFVIQPVIECGFYRACLKKNDGSSAEVGDLFSEFSLWLDCLLLTLVKAAISFLACLPGIIIALFSLAPVIAAAFRNQNPPPPNIPVLIVGIAIFLPCAILCGLGFMYSLPALVDRRQGFWDAVKTSWRLAMGNFFGSFGASLLSGLVGFLGVLVCCVGVIYSVPAIYCMIAAIYRTATTPRSWIESPPFGGAGYWPPPPGAGMPPAPGGWSPPAPGAMPPVPPPTASTPQGGGV